MSCRRSRLPLCALLGLCIVCVTVQAQVPADYVAAVKKLTEDVAAGKKISADDAKAFAKKWNDFDDVMHAAFKPAKNRLIPLNQLLKKRAFNAREKAALKKIAEMSRAMAIVTPYYDSKTTGDAAKKKDWDKWSKDMETGSASLLQAIKTGEARTIRVEAMKLASICTDCHGKFR